MRILTAGFIDFAA